MDDLISRKAAIDVAKQYWYKPDIAKALEELPSAEPEIIRCKNCKNWDTTWQNDFAPLYHYCPMVDGTRKDDWYCADAERRTKEYDKEKNRCPRWNRVIRAALEEAQPERKTGRWIPFDIPWYKCSECGAVRENKSFMENFCPNCGAKMEQEERK